MIETIAARFWLVVATAVSLSLTAYCVHHGARAESFPERPIEVIVATPAGSTTDVVTRIVTDSMAASLGKPMVINNIATAGGVVGTRAVAKLQPDGYGIGVANAGTATYQFLVKDFTLDVVKDFSPICVFGISPVVLLINTSVPANDLKELLAYARAHPSKLNYAVHAGQVELDLAVLARMAGLDMVPIYYRGGPQAFAAIQANEVQIVITQLVSARGLIASGKVRPIAITSPRAFPELIDLPVVGDTEVPGYAGSLGWTGLFGPVGMPEPIVAKLATACSAAVRNPAVVERLKKLDFVSTPGEGPAETVMRIKADVESLQRQVNLTGIKPR